MPEEPWGTVGDRSARAQIGDLRRTLAMSATGRNLLNGAQDVEYVFNSDPTGTVGSWPDGARGIWANGTTQIVIGRYLRTTGWRSVALT